MIDISDFQVEHLLLLVGGNPLPNVVAGALLVTPGGRVSLIHTRETSEVAGRLRVWIVSRGYQNVELEQVEEAFPVSVVRGVWNQLSKGNAASIGLNYTGGTKAMSVHAHRATWEWGKERGIRSVFSYLDARTLTMCFDPDDPGSGQPSHSIYVGRKFTPSLVELLSFHDFTLQCDPNESPFLPRTAKALALACSEKESLLAWKAWVDSTLRAQCHKKDKVGWKSDSQLQLVQLSLPEGALLAPAMQVLRDELNISSGKVSLNQAIYSAKPRHLCEWLDGKWLEHHVLDILNDLTNDLWLHYCAQSIVPKDIQFDVDVVALRGYQLFAFSCTTGVKKDLNRMKLFEAYVRARQLGGDEARVALVCCYGDPQGLEREIKRDVDPEGRIRVLGIPHLADLKAHIREWIRTQSGEG